VKLGKRNRVRGSAEKRQKTIELRRREIKRRGLGEKKKRSPVLSMRKNGEHLSPGKGTDKRKRKRERAGEKGGGGGPASFIPKGG